MTDSTTSGLRHIAGPIYEWSSPRDHTDGSLSRSRAVHALGPNGRTVEAWAFTDGDAWRSRLALSLPGVWRWYSDSGSSGELAVPSPGPSDRWPKGALRVSEDRRTLTEADGTPFLYLGDTDWSVVWKGRPGEWATFLDRRAAQGFNVLQVSLIPWRWDYTDVEGNRPFDDMDPTRPHDPYFRRYDQFLTMAAERGLYVCLMLIWGGPRELLPASHFSREQAVAFTRYAVARFSSFPMIWSLSGDAEYDHELPKWDAVGAAVEETDPYDHPTTNHLPPTLNWHALHHTAPWHDFHMLQTGHTRAARGDMADLPAFYYRRQPVKPIINGEPWYEAHPAMDIRGEYGPVCQPRDVRYAFWVSVLSGATMGHTYGSQGIWNWKRPGDSEVPIAGPQIGPTWDLALDHPGADQCGIGAAFLRGIQWWDLEPSPECVQLDPAPGEFWQRPACTRIRSSVWIIYLPRATGQVIVKGIEPLVWRARWLDPRGGGTHDIGVIDVPASRKWRAPQAPSEDDWVLVLTRYGSIAT